MVGRNIFTKDGSIERKMERMTNSAFSPTKAKIRISSKFEER